MEIWLENNISKETEEFQLQINYTITVPDLMVVFYSKNEVCGLNNGDSSPYHQYHFKKVSFIVGGVVDYKNDTYEIRLGVVIVNSKLIHFVMNDSPTDIFFLKTSSFDIESEVYNDYRLFNYKEYFEFQKMIEEPVMPFKKYIQYVLKSDEIEFFSLYDIPNDSKEGGYELMVNSVGLRAFFDREESKPK